MAQQLQNGKQQFFNGNGVPLAGGSVAFYLPGTLTPTNTYTDYTLATPNANPVALDANGQAVIWGPDGTFFRQIVKDSAANTIWDEVVGIQNTSLPSNVALINQAQSWSATQTFQGTGSTLAAIAQNIAEACNIVAAAPASVQGLLLASGAIQYFTASATGNWTVNLTFASGVKLNSLLSVGQAVTFAMLATQGTTGYYNSAVQVDGSSVTPYWQGGAGPSIGNASGIDVYTYTVIKTGSGAFTVLASQTRF